jgi:hypothetical protein
MRNLERLTPSEIESLRQDKRDALKKLREKSRRMAKEDSLLKVVEKAHPPITKG